MPYEIKEFQYKIAERLGVEIKQSTNPRRKIDVYKNGELLCSVGAINFTDYNDLIQQYGVHEAYRIRNNFINRHKSKCDIKTIMEIQLLWCDS